MGPELGELRDRLQGQQNGQRFSVVADQATDGNLYGAAGSFEPGTLFKLELSNLQFTTLYNFPNGIFPLNRVTQASNGLLYGSTRPTNATNGSLW
jgi:hypothetical protein